MLTVCPPLHFLRLISLFGLIFLADTSRKKVYKTDESWHSCFVPVFNVINSGFTSPQINIISWNQDPRILNLSRVFLKNECSISQNVFQSIHIVFPIWPVNMSSLYKFPNINPSNPQWTSCVTMYCSFNVRGIPLANTLFRISASIFIIKTDISFGPAFTGSWYQCYTHFIKRIWRCSFFI